MIYLDYASTTPIGKDVLHTYEKLLETSFANCDSLHDLGRENAKLMEQSRANIAQLLHVSPDEILFMAGASEANNYAIKAFALQNQRRGKHIIASCVEHSSVAHSLQQLEEIFGFEITYLPVYEDGAVRLDDVKRHLRRDTILVTCMAVNNETGAIQPIYEIADHVHAHSRAVVHSDCVQAFGKIPVEINKLDMATVSAHKIYGLKGSGFLYKKKHIDLLSWISAGQQEQGLRGGTSNAAVNIVLAKTVRLALENQRLAYRHAKRLNDYLRQELVAEDVMINSPKDASPFILNISCLRVGSEIALNALNARGFAVSAKSTCATKSKEFSHVLMKMGLGEQRATHAIRISLSHLTTMEEAEAFVAALKEIIKSYGTDEYHI